MICRYRFSPESSDAIGEGWSFPLLLLLLPFIVGDRVGRALDALVCEVWRCRLGGLLPGLGRVPVPHAGRVTVALTECESSEGLTRVLVLATVGALLVAARMAGVIWSPDTSREPNLALAEDSRPYDDPLGDIRRDVPPTTGCLGFKTGFWSVILSAPQ